METWSEALKTMKAKEMFDDKFDTSTLAFTYAFQQGYKAAQSKTLENDPKPDENDYYTGAPDASGEIYDQFLSQEYNNDLNEWQKRQAMGMSKNEYYLRCAWDATSAKLEEATSQIKALTAIKKGLESSLTECMEKLKAAQSKPADEEFLMFLVDTVWSHIYEDESVPSTELAEDLILAGRAKYKDFKTQEAIYKNYPNLNASKEEMNEMRKLK